ncbi:cobalamin biosynthesis protein CobD/CbiB [Glaciecola sp. 1036]|uniref:cobalamin biosynthesis protein CobD/CbiB n=1 Tax=Alteromonadaceae TaxID=72275 RepID=UPI003D006C58
MISESLNIPQAFIPLIILLIALLLERFFPLPPKVDPLSIWRLLCLRIGQKVMPRHEDSTQFYISGSLAFIVLALPFLIILYLIYELAYYQSLIDIMLLYLSLQFSHIDQWRKKIAIALQNNKKQLARQTLDKLVQRETEKLSDVGICKALIETYVLRIFYQQYVVMFCFLVLGPIGAFCYRLVYEASHAWNIKKNTYTAFGKPAFFVTQIIQYFPVKLSLVPLSLLALTSSGLKAVITFWFSAKAWSFGGVSILFSMGLALNRHLSGAVFRDGIKYRRSKFIGASEPNVEDIQRVVTLCHLNTIMLFLMLAMSVWLIGY